MSVWAVLLVALERPLAAAQRVLLRGQSCLLHAATRLIIATIVAS